MTCLKPTLAELQQQFQAAILHAELGVPAFIAARGPATAAEGFQVYRDAYCLRLIEALAADFPALQASLGEAGFDRLGRAYIAAAPSDQFSIRWFGRHLPGFLAESPDYAARPALQDLALFEWALSEAFDAPEPGQSEAATAVQPEPHPSLYQQLAAIPAADWPVIKLHFHPGIRRLELHYNAPQIWLAADQHQPLPAFEPVPQQAWIIWRHQLKLLFRSLSPPEAFAIDAFRHGQCFAEVCSDLCHWLEAAEVAPKAAGFLQAWLADGWVCGFEK